MESDAIETKLLTTKDTKNTKATRLPISIRAPIASPGSA